MRISDWSSDVCSSDLSLGNKGRTEAGDVQVMSAGSGIRHAEYNLEDETTTLFQIWVMPRSRGGQPSWGAKPFPKGDRSGRLVVLASGHDEDREALRIRADARLLGGTVKAGDRSEEHTSELQSLMRISYAVFCLKKKKKHKINNNI